MEYQFLRHNVYFIQLKRFNREFIMYHLSNILFYQNPEFFHFHSDSVNHEKSILITDDCIDSLIPYLDGTEYLIYNCIQVTQINAYLNESGFVKELSSKFAHENIPILYITTFQSNFILFESKFTEKVISKLI
jgi:hypothetical protein